MNKKINIAIIDDGINYKELLLENKPLHKLEITEDLKIRKWRKCPRNMLSHATICAGIISKYNSNVIINSVKILSSENRKGNANQLIKALYWCADNNIDIANLSLGSVYFKDFGKIKKCINDVTLRGLIIIAALNNNNEFTMPACLSNVIGVKCAQDFSGNHYHFVTKPLCGIDVLASGIHTLNLKTREYVTRNTNSYAAPLITAIVSRFMQQNENLSFEQIRSLLYEKANNCNKEQFVPFYYLNTDWISPCEISVKEWMNESVDHKEIMIHSIPDDISHVESVIRELMINNEKSVIHISNSRLISDILLNTPVLYKKVWDINFYSDTVNSELINIDAGIMIPVLLFKNLEPLSINISSLLRNEGYFSVFISDSFNCESDICEIIPINSQMSKFLSYIYRKYKCDIIICNIHEQNKYIDECDYDIIVSECKNIRIRYQHDNSFYEIETAHREEDVGDIYSNIKQLLIAETEIK